ncbi:hypothetical protein ACSBR1_022583 [Camellia fascicularis]
MEIQKRKNWSRRENLEREKNLERGKNEADDEKRELVFKEDGQEYAQVQRMLGNGRCEAMCIDGTKRLCHTRGKMHKKVWITAGDIILVGLRDYQDDKADVILKYMPDEARLLKAYGELPENTRLNEGIAGGLDEEDDGAGDDYIEFEGAIELLPEEKYLHSCTELKLQHQIYSL